MKASEIVMILAALATAALILVGGWSLAFYLQEPTIFQRTGALLSAFGTVGVIWQVYIEMVLEEGIKEGIRDAVSDEMAKTPRISGLRELKEKLLRNVEEVEFGKYRVHRLRLVGFFAAFLAFGIVIHGFGDMLVPQNHQQNKIVIIQRPHAPSRH
jgi:hypothetical protein